MKKFIAAIITAVICMSLFGCAAASTSDDANDTKVVATTETTEPAAPAEVDISQFPDAKEFDVFEWPSFGPAVNLPTPMWSNRGEILLDSENLFVCWVGYATIEDFNDYVKTCQDAGFTANYFSMPGEGYYGENSEGRAILVTYSKYSSYVEIQSALDTSDWNKWWENE